MVIAELETHLVELGYTVEQLTGTDNRPYVVMRDFAIAGGRLAGNTCDVAVFRSEENPWVPEAALHVRPALVEMGQLNTQPSGAGSDWQYWSRRFDYVPSARNFLTHVQTVLGEVQ